jgi:hypothetical protein
LEEAAQIKRRNILWAHRTYSGSTPATIAALVDCSVGLVIETIEAAQAK